MFCSACGFEYTQKTNYCKRCGETLGTAPAVESSPQSKWPIVAMFGMVSFFSLLGLIITYAMYDNLVLRGRSGDEVIIPLFAGISFTGFISFCLIWQLARMISSHPKSSQNPLIERHIIREAAPQPQLGIPTDPIANPVEYPSVVEHTTRQFAGARREPDPSK